MEDSSVASVPVQFLAVDKLAGPVKLFQVIPSHRATKGYRGWQPTPHTQSSPSSTHIYQLLTNLPLGMMLLSCQKLAHNVCPLVAVLPSRTRSCGDLRLLQVAAKVCPLALAFMPRRTCCRRRCSASSSARSSQFCDPNCSILLPTFMSVHSSPFTAYYALPIITCVCGNICLDFTFLLLMTRC